MTINEYLFSNTPIQKKKEVVESLSIKELSSVNSDILKRIIKEVGNAIGNSSAKELKIPCEKRPGNDWNSWFEGIGYNNEKCYVILYVQYSNTDRTLIEDLDKFLSKGDYKGSFTWNDRYGNPQTSYFRYSEVQKLQCIQSVLMEYIERKK